MNSLKEKLLNLKIDLKGLTKMILVSERINSQRCVAKDIDTTKTIIEHKDIVEDYSQEDLNNMGKELNSLIAEIKGIAKTILVSERINSQRCVAKDIDTTKTIIEHKDEKENDNIEESDIKEIVTDLKGIVQTILVSERINSQRCVAKDIDTTKTIIEHK